MHDRLRMNIHMDLQSLFGLQGRVALITGGSRGIGKMFVEGLLAAGCERIYISARKVEQMEACIAEFGADKVIGIPADLSQMDGMTQLVEALSAKEDKLDILINNAGAAWGQDYLEFSEAGWHRTMDLNVKTPFFLTQKLHNLLVAAARAIGRPRSSTSLRLMGSGSTRGKPTPIKPQRLRSFS